MKTILPLVAVAALACAAAPPAAAAQSRSGHESLPAEQDPTQDPAELAQTRALNAAVLARLREVERHNAEADRINAENQANAALDAEASARAEAAYQTDLANHDAAVRAAAAAQARYEADMAAWRERVRACESGVRSACSPQ